MAPEPNAQVKPKMKCTKFSVNGYFVTLLEKKPQMFHVWIMAHIWLGSAWFWS